MQTFSSPTSPVPTWNNSQPLVFGYSGAGSYFAGGLDDVRIYQRALTQDEVEALAGHPPSTRTVQRRYGLGLAHINQQIKQGSSWVNSYYGYDGHGSVRLLADSSGIITDTYNYDAFGVLLTSGTSGATLNNFRFAGEEWDSDLKLYYNRARYLNPDQGRFWSMDTFEGNQSDPLSLHKYLYASANPINRIDPSGEFALGDVMSSITIRVALFTGAIAITAKVAFDTHRFADASDLTPVENQKLSRAIQLISSAGNGRFRSYAVRAAKMNFRKFTMAAAYGDTLFTYRRTLLDPAALKLDDRNFAALVIHETTHSTEIVTPLRGLSHEHWYTSWWPYGEVEAYQVESDFMRAIGWTGSKSLLLTRIGQGTGDDDFLEDQANQMQINGITNPSVTP